METHSSSLAWRIPCIEEPGGLQPRWQSPTWLKCLSMHTQGQWWEEYRCLQKLNHQNCSEAWKLTQPSLPLSCLPTMRGWKTVPNPSLSAAQLKSIGFYTPRPGAGDGPSPLHPRGLCLVCGPAISRGPAICRGSRHQQGPAICRGPAISSTALNFLLEFFTRIWHMQSTFLKLQSPSPTVFNLLVILEMRSSSDLIPLTVNLGKVF